MKFIFLSLFFLCCTNFVSAQVVDTIEVYSPSMDKKIKNVIIFPPEYFQNTHQKYPVVYLLHGYNNRYDSWLKKTKPDLPKMTLLFPMILVCPDGEASWYWDSPINPKSKFETYISKELIDYINQHYRVIDSSNKRAICGYSMGGHGALYLAFRHPNIFGACGSMSGGVDICPFPENWKIKEQLGSYQENHNRWEEYSVINQLWRVQAFTDSNREVASNKGQAINYNLQKGQLAIIIDCGTEDYFWDVNEKLHQKMLYYHLSHEYIVRPGQHNHAYWNKAIEYQLFFFDRFFHSSL
ncbi:MAG: alpha/beta hydrolase family protein [Bacteroidales bacterium]